MSKKKKYYVVWTGVEPGIYDSWTACQQQIKGYPGATYKSFKSKAEAEAAYHAGYEQSVEKKSTVTPVVALESFEDQIVWDSISVDAACSGNPGVMEYQGVDTRTGFQFFHKKFDLGTNNIGEFLGLVHGLAHLKKEGKNIPIYTDSRIAIKWIKQKKCRSTLKLTARTENLFRIIRRAENWLEKNDYKNEILKWDTENWGEIPADFGRK